MKSLSKIALYVVALLGVVACLWTIFTAKNDKEFFEENMANPAISFFLIFGLLAVIFAIVLFLVYKFTDIAKHPKHLKELITLAGIIAIAVILGYVFTGFGDWISSSIVTFIILLVVSFGFLIFDTIKSIIK